MRYAAKILLLLPWLTVLGGAEMLQPDGDWRCVALTPRHLALTGDYIRQERKLFSSRFAPGGVDAALRKLPKWSVEQRFRCAATEAIASVRPRTVELLRDNPAVKIDTSAETPVKVAATGYWLNPIGQSSFPYVDGKERFSVNADVAHYLFLTLDRPLTDGERLVITLPTAEKLQYTHRTAAPSPIFKINQVGYMPEAKKYAYLGAWLGTAGALPLHEKFGGAEFRVIDEANSETALKGTLEPRHDPPPSSTGAPFTGEEVLSLDLSELTKPGNYHIVVDGIGRSETFAVGDRTMAEAFYIHARGLYHLRCGIAKERPYTNWVMPKCHQTSIRGSFPPDIAHYGKSDSKREFGFRDTIGRSVTVNHFQLIAQTAAENKELLQAPGGWHDAADWDRRPQHLGIVGDIAAVYLLKPGNFCDGQLNLPESGNKIPDFLDEALWGIDHLRRKQQPDGGVGTWEETTRHPNALDGSSAQDKLVYYLSCATRNSTLAYAAYAAELALALKQAEAADRAELLTKSAEAAWAFAVDPAKRRKRVYRVERSTLIYNEEPALAPEFLVKAGFDLYQLTGDRKYLDAAEDAADAAGKVMNKDSWRWSPLFWIELEIFPCYSRKLGKLATQRRKSLIRQAQKLLDEQEKNYPVRIAWYAPGDGWTHTMGWGNYHPLNRARTLIAAHALTGDQAFLDGAYLANDFHNGANPTGTSMTSGLGKVYPVRFLDLNSYADGIAEFVPGITPYRNTYGIPREAVRLAFGMFYPPIPQQAFGGCSLSLLPRSGLSENECVKELGKVWPIWRRWGNVESRTVAASEFTVWETIAPAAVVTGYLLNQAQMPELPWLERVPADDIRKLPGFAPLP